MNKGHDTVAFRYSFSQIKNNKHTSKHALLLFINRQESNVLMSGPSKVCHIPRRKKQVNNSEEESGSYDQHSSEGIIVLTHSLQCCTHTLIYPQAGTVMVWDYLVK